MHRGATFVASCVLAALRAPHRTWNSPAEEVKRAVDVALRSGYRHIDTAQVRRGRRARAKDGILHRSWLLLRRASAEALAPWPSRLLPQGYGNEEPIGEALAACIKAGVVTRDEVFVTTKLWVGNYAEEHALPSVRESVKKLGLEYVDLVLLHNPFRLAHGAGMPLADEDKLGYKPEDVLTAWRALEKAKEEGIVRSIGVSNFTASKMAALVAGGGSAPSVNQVEMHPCLAQQGLVDYCAAVGAVVTAYSPLGSPGRPEMVRSEGDPVPMAEDVVKAAAAAHGKSPAQVLIRWCIQRGVVCIPKSVTPARIESNGAVWDFELSADEMAAISALDMGSKGRLLKGDLFAKAGQDIAALWDGEPESVIAAPPKA